LWIDSRGSGQIDRFSERSPRFTSVRVGNRNSSFRQLLPEDPAVSLRRIVGGPTNPCEPGNLSEPGGYYGCVMVTDEGTPGNPHLELWTGTGGEYGMERFEQDVSQNSLRLPKDAGRITLSLRVWSLGNTSYVRTLKKKPRSTRSRRYISLILFND